MNQMTQAAKKHSVEIPLSEAEHAALSRIAKMHKTSIHGVLLHFGLRDVVGRAIGTRGNFDRALGETTWEGQS